MTELRRLKEYFCRRKAVIVKYRLVLDGEYEHEHSL